MEPHIVDVGLCSEVEKVTNKICDGKGRYVRCFDLFFPYHVYSLNALECVVSSLKRFEPHHRVRDFLDESMILFNNVIQVFRLPD
ncbi:hypothetical protein GCM10025859_26460 [Alicyclobacillus fastidiosus]|nr:hypothetical protein GCM10025859_26460 [Alicyclobacillus fastidiosus]